MPITSGTPQTAIQAAREALIKAVSSVEQYVLTNNPGVLAAANTLLGNVTTALSAVGVGAAGAAKTFLRQIASSTYVANAKAGSTAFGMKSFHTASEALTAIKVVHANWQVVGGNPEQGTGSVAGIKATIEYPIGGTKTQFLYSGGLTGSIPDQYELESDMLTLPVTIPAGAEFVIYSSWSNTGGVPYFSYFAGDGRAQGMANPTPDLTVPGSSGNWTVSATTGGTYAGPVAIVGMTTANAVLVLGDSISVGRGDTSAKFQGFLSRAFGAVVATGHGGSSGDKISSFLASRARRVALARYYTHVVFNFGINDVSAGDSAATVNANTTLAARCFAEIGKIVGWCTLGPVSTDTASTWASTATQTTAAQNAVRAAVNTQRLAGPNPYISVMYDPNPAVENVLSPEDGLWKPSGGNGQTNDGTHPNALGYANQGALINPTTLLSIASPGN